MTRRMFAAAHLVLLAGALGSARAEESGWLGVVLDSVDKRTKKVSFYEGAKLESVVANSPATIADLKEGDVILSVDGHDTKDAHLTELLRQMTPGSTVHVRLKRYDAEPAGEHCARE